MIFTIKFRKENDEFFTMELSAPTKLDAWIKFMAEYPKWEIASVKRAKPKKVTVQKKKNFKKKVTLNILPPEYVVVGE